MLRRRAITRLASSRSSLSSVMRYAHTPEELARCRRQVFNRKDAPLYRHIGYFVMHFGAVELYITHIMARALEFEPPDYERFHYLVRGMDAKAKIDRLFSANGVH